MLGQRIVTALILAALLVATLLVSNPWPFQLLSLLVIAAAAWEWGRLNEARGVLPLVFGAGVALACSAAWALGGASAVVPAFWWIVVAGWVVVGGLALRAGSAAWLHAPRALRWLVGLLALWATWLAIVHARGIGLGFVLSVFCVVWVADIGAYFGGRRFGRHKLAPAISPGKTWEGVWAGVAAVLVLAAVWLAGQQWIEELGPSLFSALADRFGPVLGAAALVVLSGFGVAGDLIESLVKRAAGAKDSSRLLPGHGGVLDRVDALLPVFPLALALTGR